MEEFDGSEIWEEERRREELNKPGAMLFGSVKRKKRIKLDDYTGYEDLYNQFTSKENKTIFGQPRTVEQRVDNYQGQGPGRIIIQNNNAGDGIYFYPDDPDFDKKAVESIEGWGQVFNAPAELAPLLSVKGLRPRTHHIVVPKGSSSQFKLRNAPVNQIPITQQGFRDAINLAKSIKNYKTTTPNQISGTGNQALIPKYAQSAKIYVGDKIPTSIFAYDGTNVSKTLGVSERMITGKTKDHRLMRERISADNPTAIAYRELITKYDKLKEKAGGGTLDTVISQAEFEKDIKQLFELKSKDGLDLPSKTSFSKELGNFAIDGKVQRWGSKGVLKPIDLNVKERLEKQSQIPTTVEFDPYRPEWGPFVDSERQKITTKLGLKKPEKDHMVRLENQIAILGNTLNAEGEFIKRPPEFMNQLAGELHRRGYSLGDQNLNFLQMSEVAHRTGKYSRHVVSQDMTDAEVPKTLAEAQQQQLILHDGRTVIADQKDGKYYLDGVRVKPKDIKEKGNYFFAGREYEKGQRQGLSLTTRRILAKIDNPKDLADAYELFATDAGAHEIMSGIQTAASFIYDNDAELDALSRQIRTENIPNMIKFLKYTLKNVPQYKDDPVYTELLNRFTDKLNQNMADYFSDLRQRGS